MIGFHLTLNSKVSLGFLALLLLILALGVSSWIVFERLGSNVETTVGQLGQTVRHIGMVQADVARLRVHATNTQFAFVVNSMVRPPGSPYLDRLVREVPRQHLAQRLRCCPHADHRQHGAAAD